MRSKVLLLVCAFTALLFISLLAPIWHDEALLIVEFAGHANWSESVMPASALRGPLLHYSPGFWELFHNIGTIAMEKNPPFYFVVIWFWRHIAGDSLLALRFFSVLAWLAVLGVAWLWTRSVLVVALLMLTRVAVGYATLGRNYAFACLLILLCAMLFDPDRSSRTRTLLGGVAGLLALATHYLTAPAIVAIVVFRLVSLGPRAKRWVVVGAAATLLVLAPIGYFALSGANRNMYQFLGWGHQSYVTSRMLLRLPLTPSMSMGRLFDGVGSLIFLFSILICLVNFGARPQRVRLSLYIVFMQAISLLILSYVVSRDLAQERYLFLVLPFCYVLIEDAFQRLGAAGQYAKYGVIVLALLGSGYTAGQLLRLDGLRKETWAGPVTARPKLVIVAASQGAAFPEVILAGIPDQVDLFVYREDVPTDTFHSMAAKYGKLMFCPNEPRSDRDGVGAFQKMFPTKSVWLFREYSCFVTTVP